MVIGSFARESIGRIIMTGLIGSLTDLSVESTIARCLADTDTDTVKLEIKSLKNISQSRK